MYLKGGGKTGAHLIAHHSDSIGALSILLQTYENSSQCQLKNTRRLNLVMETINRFAHLPSNSFLALLPVEANNKDSVKVFYSQVEIGLQEYNLYGTLMVAREPLCKAVASLNYSVTKEFGQILGAHYLVPNVAKPKLKKIL
ncbi:hypothetical protein B0H19DRAFT_1055639 [Mycena capillaripes]|nr:hypothetical protein B0H19DRAFT_1055639 [Mycena capillaripes]